MGGGERNEVKGKGNEERGGRMRKGERNEEREGNEEEGRGIRKGERNEERGKGGE